jgi:choline dehydrogenase-like flavoprotein
MSIRDLRVEENDEAKFTQICVIGAGFAGLVASLRLAKQGYSVVLLESGYQTLEPDIDELNRADTSSTSYAGAMTGRLRGLGGTSRRWGGRLLPLTPHDTGPRPHLSLDGWPFPIHELDIYTPEIEELFGLDNSAFEGDVLDGIDPNSVIPRCDPDIHIRLPKWPNFRRRNIGQLLQRQITRSSALQLYLGATVCGLGVDPATGRLTSVEARSLSGRKLTVNADQFLISAGTIETTRLLLILDQQSQNRAFERCNALGHYFQDHIRLEVGRLLPTDDDRVTRLFGYDYWGSTRRKLYFQLSDQAQDANAVASAYAEVRLHISDGTPLDRLRALVRDFQRHEIQHSLRKLLYLLVDRDLLTNLGLWRALTQQTFLPPAAELRLDVRIEQIPVYDNQITLSQKRDRFGVPLPKLEWAPGETELRTFLHTVQCLSNFWIRAGIEPLCPVIWNPGVLEGTLSLSDSVDTSHPSGTTRMGTMPAESVVNADLQCHAIPNIWIASASTFPTAGSANPTFTIIQLALRAADGIMRTMLPGV